MPKNDFIGNYNRSLVMLDAFEYAADKRKAGDLILLYHPDGCAKLVGEFHCESPGDMETLTSITFDPWLAQWLMYLDCKYSDPEIVNLVVLRFLAELMDPAELRGYSS